MEVFQFWKKERTTLNALQLGASQMTLANPDVGADGFDLGVADTPKRQQHSDACLSQQQLCRLGPPAPSLLRLLFPFCFNGVQGSVHTLILKAKCLHQV